jgi:hypothetical protein
MLLAAICALVWWNASDKEQEPALVPPGRERRVVEGITGVEASNSPGRVGDSVIRPEWSIDQLQERTLSKTL